MNFELAEHLRAQVRFSGGVSVAASNEHNASNCVDTIYSATK